MLLAKQKNSMTKITQENAVQELLNRIPEIKEYTDWKFIEDELDLATVIFDTFGSFLLDRILSQPLEDDVIKRSFDFINEMQESEDPHVRNLPQVGVFEVLATHKKSIEVGDRLLNKNGKEWFDKIKNFLPE